MILATSTINKTYTPDYQRWKDFKGKSVVPNAWPEGLDVTGKKIVVVGQGSTGVQIVQELSKPELKNEVTVMIRTVPFTMPLGNRPISYEESDQVKISYDALFEKSKYSHFSTHPFNLPSGSWHDATESERLAQYERLF